jgi:ribose-phosphate pyrophosphokinase
VSVVLHAFPDEARPARALAEALGVPLALVETHAFPDGEILPIVPTTASTTIVYRSLDRPNPKLVELMLAQDAWVRAGAERLVLVAPYLCYMRQDTVTQLGAPISQQAVGAFLARRFDRILTVDPHLHRTPELDQVLPGIEAQDVSASAALAAWIAATPEDSVLVGPDAEARQWVEPLAAASGREWLVLVKERRGDRDVRVLMDNGANVVDRPVLLVDDVCSTGGTLMEAARLLKARGAGPVRAVVTHALYGPDVAAALEEAGVEHVASTDSVAHPTNEIPLAVLLTDALRGELTS